MQYQPFKNRCAEVFNKARHSNHNLRDPIKYTTTQVLSDSTSSLEHHAIKACLPGMAEVKSNSVTILHNDRGLKSLRTQKNSNNLRLRVISSTDKFASRYNGRTETNLAC